MNIRKIESMEWESLGEDSVGDGRITINLNGMFGKRLLDTEYCDRIVIWWNTDMRKVDESGTEVYAIEEVDGDEGPMISRAKSWRKCQVLSAIKWVQDNLV